MTYSFCKGFLNHGTSIAFLEKSKGKICRNIEGDSEEESCVFQVIGYLIDFFQLKIILARDILWLEDMPM